MSVRLGSLKVEEEELRDLCSSWKQHTLDFCGLVELEGDGRLGGEESGGEGKAGAAEAMRCALMDVQKLEGVCQESTGESRVHCVAVIVCEELGADLVG